jgi:DNA-binding transcriptional LysR family regulator
MKYHQLRAFCAVSESGTLARAAERLYVAPTALSMQIAQLEEHLSGELFDRSTKPMSLTALGRFFLPRARELLNLGERLEQDTRDIATGRGGWLSIGFTRSLIYSILPMTVRAFRRGHPTVRTELVELLTESQIGQLRSERIQIGLSRLTRPVDPPPGFKHTLLFNDPLVAALPYQPGSKIPPIVELSTLQSLPLISFPKDSLSGYPEFVRSSLRAAGIEPRVEHEAIEIHTALGLVAADLGYAMVGASVAHRGPRDVCFRRVSSMVDQTRVVAVTREDEQNPLVASMLELLEKFAVSGPSRQSQRSNAAIHK